MNEHLQQRIMAHVRRIEGQDCWIWTGQVSNSGYGNIMIRDDSGQTRIESADIASYRAFVGELPPGTYPRQSCGNRLCVNPRHLQIDENIKHQDSSS